MVTLASTVATSANTVVTWASIAVTLASIVATSANTVGRWENTSVHSLQGDDLLVQLATLVNIEEKWVNTLVTWGSILDL